MNIQKKILDLKLNENEIAIFWLGNASFAIKTDRGKIIYIDPYLSNYAEKLYGFKRIFPSPIKPPQVKADYILISHEHGDHLDMDSIPQIMKQQGIKLVAPEPCIDKCEEYSIKEDKLIEVNNGDIEEFTGFKLITVFADHGDLAPQAVGYILDFGTSKIYYTGDTAYTPEKMETAFSMKPEIVIPPINGKFNNMDPWEAAMLVRDCKAKIAIPAHFCMFAEHNGNPGEFVKYIKQINNTKCKLITMGDYYIYNALEGGN